MPPLTPRSAARLAVLTMLALPAIAAAQTRPDRPAPPPQPRGLGSVLGDLGSGTDWPAPAGAPAPDLPAPPGAPRDAALAAAVAALTRQIDHARTLTRETVDVRDMTRLERMAAEFRHRYDAMRDRLYLGDPAPGTAAADALAAFDARWSTLAARLWAGDRAKGLIDVPEWDAARPHVAAAACPIPATIPDTVARGVLDGPAWACTMNAFFADLAAHEARTNASLASARDRALAPLAEALADLDGWMTATAAARGAAPDDPGLLREFTWRVLQTWIAGAEARRRELERIGRIDPASPFQRFRGHAPAVVGPDTGGAIRIALDAGGTLHVRLGSREAARPVVEAPYSPDAAGLARELHDLHYRLQTLADYFDRLDRERRAGGRPWDDDALRVARARRTIEGRIVTLLQRIASR